MEKSVKFEEVKKHLIEKKLNNIRIAEECGVDPSFVSKVKLGLGFIKNKRLDLTDRYELIKKDIKEGLMINDELRAKHKVSVATLARMRAELGLKGVHSKNSKQRKVDVEEYKHLLGNIPDTHIAAKFGLSRERIRQVREKFGVDKYNSS